MRDIKPSERGDLHNRNNKCSRRDERLMIRHSKAIEQSDVGSAAITYEYVLSLIMENRKLRRQKRALRRELETAKGAPQ